MALEHSERAGFAACLVRVVALHDADTAAHLRATAAIARRVAVALGLDNPAIEAIELGALLHDIGKVEVRREVLRKPAELSSSEIDEMRRHAQTGARMLEATPPLAHLAPIVRAHHERIDGCGYPDGLRGDEIPLEARVIAVADAFHALTTDRPYRRAVGGDCARRIIAAAAGPQFDDAVVAALLRVVRDGRSASRLTA